MKERRDKIIAAASQLFAERGFGGTTVRAICKAAGVNVALINYYFKTKGGLYEASLERMFATSGGPRISTLDAGVRDEATWRRAVTVWVRALSRAMHEKSGEGSWPMWIFRHEVTSPSPMSAAIRRKYGLPVFNCLRRLIMMGARSEREAMLWVTSIWAQLSAVALVDSSWHGVFRPSGFSRDRWGRAFADFVLTSIFRELHYHG